MVHLNKEGHAAELEPRRTTCAIAVKRKSTNASLLLVNKRIHALVLRVFCRHLCMRPDRPPSIADQQILSLLQRSVQPLAKEASAASKQRVAELVERFTLEEVRGHKSTNGPTLQLSSKLLWEVSDTLRQLCVPSFCLDIEAFARFHLPALKSFRITGSATAKHLRIFDLMSMPVLEEVAFDDIPPGPSGGGPPLFCRPTLRCLESSMNSAQTLLPLSM